MELINVNCPKYSKPLKLNAFWLRDHCRCELCYNTTTKQRKFELFNLPEDLKVQETSNTEDNRHLIVKWDDGHLSTYSFEFLYNSQLEGYLKARNANAKIPWNVSDLLNSDYGRIKLSDLVTNDREVFNVVNSLWRYGVAFIEDVPPNQTMTEMAIRRVFPVMHTFFGGMFTITDGQDHADIAYSKAFLNSHTDNTYFCDAAGLQALHCIAHNGTGGENFFVDGLKIAHELKASDPSAYDTLTKVHVPGEYIEDGQHHIYYAPLLRTNPVTGELIQVRLNVPDRAVFNTIPQTEMAEFYRSFKAFLKLVEKQENQWKLKLNPGTIIIFDNWRLFHGRYAYTGFRKMTGCFIQRTDFLSKARILGIIE